MKILIINDHLPLVAGAEKMIHEMKRELEKKGHTVELFGSTKGENFRSLFSRWYSKKWYKKTKEKIESFSPDVVHINNCARVVSPSVIKASVDANVPTIYDPPELPFICPRSGGVYKKKRKKKLFANHHCFYDDCLGYDEKISDIPRNMWRLLKLLVQRRMIKNDNVYYISNSQFLKGALKKSFNIDSKVICHGVKVPKKQTNYKKKIIFAGQLTLEKGLDSIGSVLNEVKGYDVDILGRGPLMEEFKKKYPNLTFHGFQNLENYYLNASIAIVPSIWLDTYPLTVIEAMSYGLCVIGSDIGGISEQIQHKKTGLLFKPGDKKDFEKKLKYALDNPKEVKRMGKNARNFIKKHLTWDTIIKEWEKTYREAITRNKNAA